MDELEDVITQIVLNPSLHAKWLNTLSYLENCGARKIAGCEHPTKVKEEMLKHAAEEFRHAYYLKQQISKIYTQPVENYSLDMMLGGIKSLHYLRALDLLTSRLLVHEYQIRGSELKRASYLLVTYAIEMRAGSLYPLYHKVLKNLNSKVQVKSIILEEEEHLHDMFQEIMKMDNGPHLSKKVCSIESSLNFAWKKALTKELEGDLSPRRL